ncbi:hypothetical protein [Okeania sp. SIO1I7]|uniref:hypothetical protein n=1 Tax=Okeania sp. SIO1I7 TaxID=2607772 RepID=UPI0013FC6E4E|nr:hypothetical protein [Okeania sp. SIO1I7]NET28449.1 hypothetical protein [Okeania sp. SIO1I7]
MLFKQSLNFLSKCSSILLQFNQGETIINRSLTVSNASINTPRLLVRSFQLSVISYQLSVSGGTTLSVLLQ